MADEEQVRFADGIILRVSSANIRFQNIVKCFKMLRHYPNPFYCIFPADGRRKIIRFFTRERVEIILRQSKSNVLLFHASASRVAAEIVSFTMSKDHRGSFSPTQSLSKEEISKLSLQFLKFPADAAQGAAAGGDGDEDGYEVVLGDAASAAGASHSDDEDARTDASLRSGSSSAASFYNDSSSSDSSFKPSDDSDEERAVPAVPEVICIERDGSHRFDTDCLRKGEEPLKVLQSFLEKQHRLLRARVFSVADAKLFKLSEAQMLKSEEAVFCESNGLPLHRWVNFRRDFIEPYRIEPIFGRFKTGDKVFFLNGCVVRNVMLLLVEKLAKLIASAGARAQPACLHLQLGIDGKSDTSVTVGGGKILSLWLRFGNVACDLPRQSTRRAVPLGLLVGSDKVEARVCCFLDQMRVNCLLERLRDSGLQLPCGRKFSVLITNVGDLPAIRLPFQCPGRLNLQTGGPAWHSRPACPWCRKTLAAQHAPSLRIVRIADDMLQKMSPSALSNIQVKRCLYGFLHASHHLIINSIVDVA